MTRGQKIPLAVAIFVWLIAGVPAVGHGFCFDEAGDLYGINPGLLRSIARTESSMNPKAVHRNRDGTADIGLMQVNSTWIPALKLDETGLMSDPCYNVRAGARILKSCIDRWGYSWQAVGCYHAVGKGRQIAYSWKIYRELKKGGERIPAEKKQAVDSTKTDLVRSSLQLKVRNQEEPAIGCER